ncbi:MAG: HlyC/CorC family transporter [Spirochaetales bacterium]|nr:HlyC/CorC family transporter [Spirochaetales bacterium]
MIILGIILCIIFAAFFAGMETGLLSANQLTIYSKKEKGAMYARNADFLLHRPERLLATTLIGTNIAVVTGTVFFLILLRSFHVPDFVEWIGVFVLTVIFLVFSEIIPKSFFRNHADSITLRLSPVLLVFYYLFLPISVLINTLIRIIVLVFGNKASVRKLPTSREDLRYLVKLRSREIALSLQDQRLVDDIFDFPNTKAREVMIPFPKMPVCSADASIAEVIRLSKETRARFISIFTRRPDNIIGYIDIEDFLLSKSGNIVTHMRDAVFYPETKRIPNLLLDMNQKRLDVVFLCDEYGIISGIITPNEIVADIVGHIPGEINTFEDDIQALSPNRYILEGTMGIDDLYSYTGILLERGEYDTIGGFLCEKLGEIPKTGMVYNIPGAVLKVIERDKRHIKRIEIVKMEKSAEES